MSTSCKEKTLLPRFKFYKDGLNLIVEKLTFDTHDYWGMTLSMHVQDKSGFSDPFAVVYVGTQKETTKHVSQTLNPKWDETFYFDVPEGQEHVGKDTPNSVL